MRFPLAYGKPQLDIQESAMDPEKRKNKHRNTSHASLQMAVVRKENISLMAVKLKTHLNSFRGSLTAIICPTPSFGIRFSYWQ